MQQSTFNGRKHIQVTFQPNIGLDSGARQSVVEMLNVLLADEKVLAKKTHRAYESGASNGTELRPLCEGQYRQLKETISEIGERVSILGGSTLSITDQSLASARLDGNVPPVADALSILADHEAFIRYLREDAQRCSEEYEDQGTFAILVSVMQLHEKMAWVLRSYIQDELTNDESKTNA